MKNIIICLALLACAMGVIVVCIQDKIIDDLKNKYQELYNYCEVYINE